MSGRHRSLCRKRPHNDRTGTQDYNCSRDWPGPKIRSTRTSPAVSSRPVSGVHEVQRPVAPAARQFAHAVMLARRITARMLTQPVDRCPDRGQSTPSHTGCARLGQPAANPVQIGERLIGIAQLSRHTGRRSTARVWNRQFVVGADTVDPRIHVFGIDEPAGSDVRIGLGQPFSLPCEPAPLLR
jgi:hypothetical protein